MSKSATKVSWDEVEKLSSHEDLVKLLARRNVPLDKINLDLAYDKELRFLQIELLKLQDWVKRKGKRIEIVFEGRDASGKGGTIRRFAEQLQPRASRIVALTKPTNVEKGQWYFRRYIKELPNPGEIVFFDRSWYNRAVVEPVMGFCTKKEHKKFLLQAPEFEHMLYEDGLNIVKFWFSITREEQQRRFESRKRTFIKQWKFSPVDEKAQELWEDFTKYKQEMFARTHTSYAPWIIVDSNDKKVARLESIRYVLSLFNYKGKDTSGALLPDPNTVSRYNRSLFS
jgi:polyphosphate kinase 2